MIPILLGKSGVLRYGKVIMGAKDEVFDEWDGAGTLPGKAWK